MATNQLKKFLVKAKINSYALIGEGGEKILSDGSKEIEFREKDFEYRDRYFGFNHFVGQEVVFQSKKFIWGMNYYGKVISKSVPPRQIYQFFQESLRRTPGDKPFRGPKRFKKNDFQYLNRTKGNIEEFEGEEEIFYKGKLTYRLIYQGGIVMEK